MILSKTTGYGIQALAYLARQPESRRCGLQEVADKEKAPPVFLRKILGELRRHRLVTSVKGIHGGYALARPASHISLWDVFKILDPDPYWDGCVLGYGPCSDSTPCALCPIWKRHRDEFFGVMKQMTIADVARQSGVAARE